MFTLFMYKLGTFETGIVLVQQYLLTVYKNIIEVSYLNHCNNILTIIEEEFIVSSVTSFIFFVDPISKGVIRNWNMYSFSSIIQ